MFNKLKVVTKTNRKRLRYIVNPDLKSVSVYDTDKKLYDVKIDPDSISIKYARTTYSTKDNDAHLITKEHKKIVPMPHNDIKSVKPYWSPFKAGLSIPGKIRNNVFVVSERFYFEGYEYGCEGEYHRT